MRLYYSGWQSTNLERESAVLKAVPIRCRCFSYGMLEPIPGLVGHSYIPSLKAVYELHLKNGTGIMMDSGAISYRNFKQTMTKRGLTGKLAKLVSEDDFIRLYIDYVKQNQMNWDFYCTLDLVVDAEDIFRRHRMLEKAGIRPTPVIHGDGDIVDYMKRYADMGYKLIAVGSPPVLKRSPQARARFFDSIFNEAIKHDQKIHGLAQTSCWAMLTFPFTSVDSVSWSWYSVVGQIIMFDEHNGRLSTLHITGRYAPRKVRADNNSVFMESIREYVQLKGHDFEALKTNLVARHIWNAGEMNRLTDVATKKHEGAGSWNLLF